ncbi:hypothetical protein FF011L_18900 [Roseimaritima multifibrata]|uniref:Uncharacterized protein n=2 Tax=Roseimaritima multifibrata TaxID=1930274 RepID=A0A517ME14_9BACT|nr:hypothetical protein FF011L_18900 [Roseimaritima multifibrata]
MAEVEWNAQSNRYEVAFRCDPRDLDRALSASMKMPIVIEQLPKAKAEKYIQQYLDKHLKLFRQTEDGEEEPVVAKRHWVGYELDDRGKYLWLYFEWEPSPGDAPLKIENRMFMQVEPTHISSFTFTDIAEKPSLHFTSSVPVKNVPLPARKSR